MIRCKLRLHRWQTHTRYSRGEEHQACLRCGKPRRLIQGVLLRG